MCMWPQQQMKGTKFKNRSGYPRLGALWWTQKKKKKRRVSNGENCLLFRNSGSLRYNCKIPSIGGFRPSQGATLFSRIRVCGTIYRGDIPRQPAAAGWSLKGKNLAQIGAEKTSRFPLSLSLSPSRVISISLINKPIRLRKCVDGIVAWGEF